MPDNDDALAEIRRAIDSIDAEIHDLLIRRAEIGGKIRGLKPGGGTKIRPAREAEVLRALIARHRGPFSKAALIRIWREIMAAMTRLQGSFSVAIFAPEEGSGCWDLARDQYGSSTPMTAHQTRRSIIETVSTGDGVIGVLPYPLAASDENWWRHLVGEGKSLPKIVARLPFYEAPSVRDEDAVALVIAMIGHEPSGDDRTLVVLELTEDISGPKLVGALSEVGLEGALKAKWHDTDTRPERWLNLMECRGFASPGDDRLERVAANMGGALESYSVVGGFAEPLSAADLSPVETPT